jgi:hypothetical protein
MSIERRKEHDINEERRGPFQYRGCNDPSTSFADDHNKKANHQKLRLFSQERHGMMKSLVV